MTTGNKRKLAALNEENCEEHPRSNLAQNSSAARSQEDYITQVSEEIEGRVTKSLSKEFSRTENRILGALARLDDFLMNPILPGHSGTTPEPSRNALNTSQGTNEDDSQNDPRPVAGLFHGQITQNSGPEDRRDMVTGATEQIGNCHKRLEFTRKSHTALVHLQGSRRKTVLPVNHNSAVKTHLRRSKQFKFCWPFSSWQILTILRTFTMISTEIPNCQSH